MHHVTSNTSTTIIFYQAATGTIQQCPTLFSLLIFQKDLFGFKTIPLYQKKKPLLIMHAVCWCVYITYVYKLQQENNMNLSVKVTLMLSTSRRLFSSTWHITCCSCVHLTSCSFISVNKLIQKTNISRHYDSNKDSHRHKKWEDTIFRTYTRLIETSL